MALSTTTELVDFIMTEIVESEVISAGYENNVAAPLVRARDLRGTGTESAKFPKFPLLTAAAVAEGTDLTNTTFNPTNVTISTSEAGIRVDVTDRATEAQNISQSALMAGVQQLGIPAAALTKITQLLPYANECAKAVMNHIDTQLLAESANAGNTVGTTTTPAQFDDFIAGIFQLENNHAQGRLAAVLHPKQIQDLRQDSVNNAATAFSLLPEAVKNAILTSRNDGFVANVLGVDVYRSTLVPDANAAADHGGLFMPTGADGDARNITSPIGLVIGRITRVEVQRDASARVTEINVTASFGVGTIDANRLVAIETDHV